MKWLRDAYRGFLWPYLAFVGGAGFGSAGESHSWWHWATWPCFAAGLVGLSVAHSRVKAGQQ